ncbi:unnamed protein product [Aphanomyces euteiches]
MAMWRQIKIAMTSVPLTTLERVDSTSSQAANNCEERVSSSANYPVDAIESWECDRHEKYLRGMPKSKLDDVEIEELFHKAIAGATSYATSHAESQGTLEVKQKSPQLDPPIEFESIVWAKVIGYPWLPAYVLNPFHYDTQAKGKPIVRETLNVVL